MARFPFLTSKRMFSVNLIVIVESVHSIATHKRGDTDHFFIPAVASVASALGSLCTHPHRPETDVPTIAVKLVLFLYCSAVRKNSSQVHVLWEDHRNDLFINGFGTVNSSLRLLIRATYPPQVSLHPRVAANGPGVCPLLEHSALLSNSSTSRLGPYGRHHCAYGSGVITPGFPHRIFSVLTDCVGRQWRMGLHDLQRIRAVGWKIRPSRFYSTSHLQGDDVQQRYRKNRYRSRLPCKLLSYLKLSSHFLNCPRSLEWPRLLRRGRHRYGRKHAVVESTRHQPAAPRYHRGPTQCRASVCSR